MAEEQIRLLICHTCHSVQELPWCGEDKQCQHPACIEPLQARLAEHHFADGRPHIGDLGSVPKRLWDRKSERPGLLREIEKYSGPPGTGQGLGVSTYETMASFEEEAVLCWKRHNRTLDCGDYKTDRMRLLADTKAERKDLGLTTRASARPSHHLCDYCPVKSIKMQRRNSELYGYNYSG